MGLVTPAFTLSIGPSRIQYTVLQEFLRQCPELAHICRSNPWSRTIALPELDEDIGHTLVHYLYTGTYQTLKPRDVSGEVERITGYKRNVHLYCAARTYGPGGLELLVKGNIESFEETRKIIWKSFLERAATTKGPAKYSPKDLDWLAWKEVNGRQVRCWLKRVCTGSLTISSNLDQEYHDYFSCSRCERGEVIVAIASRNCHRPRRRIPEQLQWRRPNCEQPMLYVAIC